MKIINLNSKFRLSDDSVKQHSYLIETRGYSIIEDFLGSEEVEILKLSMENALNTYEPVAGVERSYLDRYQLHDLMARDINFARLLEDQRLQQLIEPHLGPHWIMYASTSSSIPPHGSNYASRMHVDSPRFRLGYAFNMGLIWTLDECTLENGGALRILPGSHHSEKIPSLEFFESNYVSAVCKAGSLIIFNARVYHRTFKNKTDSWNHSMTLNACRSFMKQRIDWVRFLPEEITSALNSQARRLIGFDTRLPTTLSEFYVEESQRLYKPNQG
jgi:ectoine hydroxylase-related dioxygenase (phytanoyl-CoA dioxygenase family)